MASASEPLDKTGTQDRDTLLITLFNDSNSPSRTGGDLFAKQSLFNKNRLYFIDLTDFMAQLLTCIQKGQILSVYSDV